MKQHRDTGISFVIFFFSLDRLERQRKIHSSDLSEQFSGVAAGFYKRAQTLYRRIKRLDGEITRDARRLGTQDERYEVNDIMHRLTVDPR